MTYDFSHAAMHVLADWPILARMGSFAGGSLHGRRQPPMSRRLGVLLRVECVQRATAREQNIFPQNCPSDAVAEFSTQSAH